MRRDVVFCLALSLPACSTSSGSGTTESPDATGHDANTPADSAGSGDSTTQDTGATSDAAPDARASGDDAADASDGGGIPDLDAGDAGACPASWLVPPTVDPSIAVPADAGGVVLVHASANGTQNYACTAAADGGLSWTLVGPAAELRDCHAVIGHHFASEGGAAAPEWMLDDGSYAIGRRVAGFVPDGGASSIPWVLLQVVGRSDAGILDQATYVQRLNTNGGIAPIIACSPDSGATNVPYTADYFFYGP
jgi:hypothetical protein